MSKAKQMYIESLKEEIEKVKQTYENVDSGYLKVKSKGKILGLKRAIELAEGILP